MANIIKPTATSGSFCLPLEYASEIRQRLEKCGQDGLILLAIESWGESLGTISIYLRKPVWVIRKKYNKALGYVSSGPARRWHTTSKRMAEEYGEFRKKNPIIVIKGLTKGD